MIIGTGTGRCNWQWFINHVPHGADMMNGHVTKRQRQVTCVGSHHSGASACIERGGGLAALIR